MELVFQQERNKGLKSLFKNRSEIGTKMRKKLLFVGQYYQKCMKTDDCK